MWTQKRTFPFAHLPGDPEAAIPVATPEAPQTSHLHSDEDDAVLVTHASQSRFVSSFSYVVVPLSSDEQAMYRRYFVAPEMDPTTEGEEEPSQMNSNSNIAYPQCVELFLLGFSDGTVGCYRIAPSHLRWHPAVSPPFTPFPLHHDDQQQVMSLSTLGTLVLSCGADGVAQLSMIDVTPVLRSTPSSSVLGEKEIIATPSPTRVASIATLPAIHRHGENGDTPIGLRCGLLWEGASHWACASGESSAVYIFTGDDQGRVVLYRVDVLTKTWFIHSVFAPIVYGAQGDYRAVTLSAKDCPAPRWLESPIFCLTLDSEAVEAVTETTDNDDRRTTTTTTTHVRLVAGGDRRLFVWDLSHIPLRQTSEKDWTEEGHTDRTQTASNNTDGDAGTENERLRKKTGEVWDTPLVASQTLWNRYVWLQPPPPSPPSSASTCWFGGEPKEVTRAIKRWRQASNAQALGIVVNHSIHHHRTEKDVESAFPRPKETTHNENGGNNSSDDPEPIAKTSSSTQVVPQTTPSATATTTSTVTVLFDDRKRSVEAPLFAVRYVQIPILCAQISHGMNGGAVRAMVRLHEGVLVTGDDAGVLSVWAWNVMEEKYVGVTSTQQPSTTKKDSREGEQLASSSKSAATQQPSVEGNTSPLWLRGHRRAVRSLLHFPVANSPLRFVSTSLDGFVKVWSLTTPSPPTSSSAPSADGTALPRLQLEVNSVLRLEAAAAGGSVGAADLPASAATRPTVGVGCAVVFPPFLVLFATAEFDATVRAFQFLEVSGCAPPPGMLFDGVRTVRVNNQANNNHKNTETRQKTTIVCRQGDEATLPARHVDPLVNCHRDGDRHEAPEEVTDRFVSERFGTRLTEDEDGVAPPGVETLLGCSSSSSDDEVGEENPNKPFSQQQRLRNDSTSDTSSSSSDDEEEGDVTGLGCVPTVQDVLCEHEHNLEKKRKQDGES